MKLITLKQHDQLMENGNPQNRGRDHIPVVKLLIKEQNVILLISELLPGFENIAFGIMDMGLTCPQIGYFDLESLKFAENKSKKQLLERDNMFKGIFSISTYYRAARAFDKVIEDENQLNQFRY